MATILVGIDGTGPRVMPGKKRNAAYDISFAKSWVRRLCNLHGGKATLYLRGPVMMGGGLVDAVNEGYQYARDYMKRSVNHKVLLTGYSRGAAGVVAIANKLNRAKIPVEAIMLFDCVDRHVVIDAEVIPPNVKHVRHVVRNPAAKSRESFSNDGLRFHPEKTDYPAAYQFMCTHGGMGGMPWQPDEDQSGHDIIDEGGIDGKTAVTFAQDARGARQVWDFCTPFFTQHKFH
ncbi:MAG: hypothetical protein AAFN77_05640 [Planctomycetota bacterium]